MQNYYLILNRSHCPNLKKCKPLAVNFVGVSLRRRPAETLGALSLAEFYGMGTIVQRQQIGASQVF